MVAVVAAGYAEPALELLTQLLAVQGLTAWRLGEVTRDDNGTSTGHGRVRMNGDYAACHF
jgi:hypothetical protein